MRITKTIGLGALLLVAANVSADPIIGGQVVVAQDGAVNATFLAGYGSFSDDLLLYLPTNGYGVIFNNQTTAYGTVFDLGTFSAGTELQFQIYVMNTGATWYSGDAARNSDGLAHNMVINEWAPGMTVVGFEDLVGAGDQDYDDLAFGLSNAYGTPAVPEPGTVGFLGLGLIGLAWAGRRKRA